MTGGARPRRAAQTPEEGEARGCLGREVGSWEEPQLTLRSERQRQLDSVVRVPHAVRRTHVRVASRLLNFAKDVIGEHRPVCAFRADTTSSEEKKDATKKHSPLFCHQATAMETRSRILSRLSAADDRVNIKQQNSEAT